MKAPAAAEWFVAALPPGHRRRAGEIADLPERLAALWDAGRAAWPDVPLEAAVFFPYLAERIEPDVALAPAMAQVRGPDLYLACACAQADPVAREVLEREYLRHPRVLRAFANNAAISEEALGLTRQRVLFGDPGQPPRIAHYGGRGDLGRWLAVVAFRVAREIHRRVRREVGLPDEAVLGPAATAGDPEMSFLKERYRAEFLAAFRASFAALAPGERNLLRHAYLDGLTAEQIGALYQVHGSTAGRRLARVREQILRSVRQHFLARQGMGRQELESLMMLIRSQLDFSLRTLLPETESAERPGGGGAAD